jgi:hypothetical protein
MTRARACLAADFKNCCMQTGEFDGSDRDHFFPGLMNSGSTAGAMWRGGRGAEVAPAPGCDNASATDKELRTFCYVR